MDPIAVGAPGRPVRRPRLDVVRGTRVVSNGAYTVLLHSDATGVSFAGTFAVTPWPVDPWLDATGLRVYVRDLASGRFAILGAGGVPTTAAEWRPGVAVLHAAPFLDLDCTLEVAVAVDTPCEVRRLTLHDRSDSLRRLEITTYLEVVLAPAAAYAAHPGFSKLFVQTDYDRDAAALLARRRPRAADEAAPWLYHAFVGAGEPEFETDRARFLGRGGSVAAPKSLRDAARLAATIGNVLDPVLCLRRAIELQPGASAATSFVLGLAPERRELESGARRMAHESDVDAVFDAARRTASARLAGIGMQASEAAASETLAGAVLDVDTTVPSLADAGAAVAQWWKHLALPIECAAGGDPGVTTAEWLEPVVVPAARDLAPAPADSAARPDATPIDLGDLTLANGVGGFAAAGREYVVRFRCGTSGLEGLPPQPWTNVIANPDFGCIVSETGAGTAWNRNSREHRLTAWLNDPVLDPHADAVYLRDDDEEGVFWSPMPGPAPAPGTAFEVRHGIGCTHFRSTSHDIETRIEVFVPRHDPVRIVRLQITNRSQRRRRLSVFDYVHWVLGTTPEASGRFVQASLVGDGRTVTARNAQAGEFADGVAFATVVAPGARVVRASGDRSAFLGRPASMERPAIVRSGGALETVAGGVGLNACAVHQIELGLAAGETADVAFLLGEVVGEPVLAPLLARYADLESVDAALADVRAHWDHLVSGIQIETPSAALDIMTNAWLPYQTLSCRIWGRTAFYQSGGAFGFRDQLQDAAALVHLSPVLLRAQILMHAAHQFRDGDVLHWWHPPGARGIRTRFADDLLWLPYLTAYYVQTTGDAAILDAQVPFVAARGLEPGEDEIFVAAETTAETASLYDHCCRALDRSLTRGAHGLPLFGTGDWNDGMNRVGREGRGESVWMGFFLDRVLADFTPFCEQRHDRERLRRFAAYREDLRAALETAGWDGEWYRRGYYDDGTPLGSHASDECRIDALVQAWAVLSGTAPPERARQALAAAERHLISEDDGVIRLLWPPFVDTPHDPGYIKGYVAGVRENGGQYTHAALWVVRAFAELGRNDRVARLLEMLTPVHHTRSTRDVARYRVEPYVVAADVYAAAPHVGRGGWTWYTGSSGWMYRVVLESLLGMRVERGDTLVLSPCVPDEWPGFRIRYRVPDAAAATTYTIEARNPDARGRGVAAATLDGKAVTVGNGVARLPLARDGVAHRVELVLGGPA